jgi:hypothetical protein
LQTTSSEAILSTLPKRFLAWSKEHLKDAERIIYMPRQRISFTRDNSRPPAVSNFAQLIEWPGPILMQHDFFTLIAMSNQANSISQKLSNLTGVANHQHIIKFHNADQMAN